jgi:hypothetical protein
VQTYGRKQVNQEVEEPRTPISISMHLFLSETGAIDEIKAHIPPSVNTDNEYFHVRKTQSLETGEGKKCEFFLFFLYTIGNLKIFYS